MSCGFHSVFMAFSILLGFDVTSSGPQSLSDSDLKNLLATIYGNFYSHKEGLQGEVLECAFGQFNPKLASALKAGTVSMTFVLWGQLMYDLKLSGGAQAE